MLDIVATHENELALPVDVEGVHNAQPRLACAPACGPDPAREQRAHDQQQHKQQDDHDNGAQHIGRGHTKFVKQGLHHGFHPAGRLGRPSLLILTH